jgi:hypothetical protein
MIDPRLFLTLPEHASSANHLWNCALFLTQMSHMNSQQSLAPAVKLPLLASDSSSSLAPNPSEQHNELEPYSSSSSFESILNEMKHSYTNAYPSSISNSYMSLINETIANVLKIKKRNKASYFHLALVPFNYYAPSGKVACGSQFVATSEEEARTMPWLDREGATVSSQCCSSSGTDDYDYEEGGSESEKINESDESHSLGLVPCVDHGCRR